MSEEKAIRSLLADSAREQAGQPRVLVSLDEKSSEFVSAIRRSVPILMRKSVPIEPEAAKLVKGSELIGGLQQPYFHVPLVTDPGGARAMLLFEAGAVAYLLEAALGGSADEDSIQTLTEITNAQKAAIGRLAEPMVKLFSDALAPLGVRVRRLPAMAGVGVDGEFAATSFAIAGNPERRVVFAIMRDAIPSTGMMPMSRGRAEHETRVPAILCQVEVDLVAELGRVRRRLSEIDSFRVGDVIRLDTALRSPIQVRVQGKPILKATPTTSGTQLAFSVVERLEAARAPSTFEGRSREVEVALLDPV